MLVADSAGPERRVVLNGTMTTSSKHQADRYEASAKSGDDNYRLLVEDSSEGLVAFDRDLRVTIWNGGMVRMTGMSRADCVGKPAVDVFAALGVLGVEESLAKTLRGESDTLKNLSLQDSTTQISRLQADYRPVRDEAGEIVGGMVSVRDVSDRAGLENALVESEQKHRVRFLRSADAILIIDRRGLYIDANPAACKLTGYTREELTTMSVAALTPQEERPKAEAKFQKLLTTGVTRSEQVVARKDGRRVAVDVHSIDLGDGTFQASLRDIAERQKANEQLHQALQRLRFHIDRMPLGYIVWSTNMEIIEWNPACERIFGWKATEILGSRWERLVPDWAHPPVEKTIGKLLAGDISSHSVNENLRKDRTVITCEWFNTPLRDSQGAISGAASMMHDVTERRMAESQLRHAQKTQSLGVLTRGIAHDFGNLLTVVQGNVNLLQNMSQLPERAREYLGLINEASTKASELTNHLLAFARTGRHNPELCDLNEVILGALKLLHGSLGRGVEVSTKLDATIPRVEVDRGQTEQIVLNLCLNAAQAMPSGGLITVRTKLSQLGPREATRSLPHDLSQPGPRVELAVSDVGHGMDEATISRIFDPFFTTKKTGHGLGLAAVLGILRQHGAQIVPKSTPGKGSTFHLYFPIPESEDHSQSKGRSLRRRTTKRPARPTAKKKATSPTAKKKASSLTAKRAATKTTVAASQKKPGPSSVRRGKKRTRR